MKFDPVQPYATGVAEPSSDPEKYRAREREAQIFQLARELFVREPTKTFADCHEAARRFYAQAEELFYYQADEGAG